MSIVYRGSCLCGTVRYEVRGGLGDVVLCHCGQCRKAQGSAFAANAPVRAADFRLLTGETVLKGYASSPGKHRMFCGECGSPIYSVRETRPEVLRLRVGTLDTPLSARPVAHIHVAGKAGWFGITDALPQYPAQEPGRDRG